MSKPDLEKLLSIVKGKRKVFIITHENPDPDSIASAFGLKYIFRKALGVTSVIAYSGIIGRVENQCMVKLLGIDMTPLNAVNLRNSSVVILVDCQPHTGNVVLPPASLPMR